MIDGPAVVTSYRDLWPVVVWCIFQACAEHELN